jgi:nitrite reductase/ring-hydroxylating ferredoxin subunit
MNSLPECRALSTLAKQHGGSLSRNQCGEAWGWHAGRPLPQAAVSGTFAPFSGAEQSMAEWFVAMSSELKDGDRRIVTAGQREIGVFHKDGAYYAYSNICLHQGGPACEGVVINNVIDIINPDRTYEGQKFGDDTHFVCPWHGWEYDIKTGEMVGDRKQKLRKFEVIKRGDELYVVA